VSVTVPEVMHEQILIAPLEGQVTEQLNTPAVAAPLQTHPLLTIEPLHALGVLSCSPSIRVCALAGETAHPIRTRNATANIFILAFKLL
jgi:hypothetical protein